MGFSAVVAVVSTVASVAAGVVQSKKAKKARKKAKRQEIEARDISKAAEQNVNRINRRRVLREERVRRSRIIAAAEGAGAGVSSGAISAPGIIGTNVAAAIAAQSSGTIAAEGISSRLQSAAGFRAKASEAIAAGNLFSSVATGVSDVVKIGEEFDIFKSTKPTTES